MTDLSLQGHHTTTPTDLQRMPFPPDSSMMPLLNFIESIDTPFTREAHHNTSQGQARKVGIRRNVRR